MLRFMHAKNVHSDTLFVCPFNAPDVHTATRIVQQFRGFLQVLQPANALFLFDRHVRRIDPTPQSIPAVELVSLPEFECG
jgi:hypothetical protein